MFRLRIVLLGLYRHFRRTIVSCLLLTAVLAVGFCGFSYAAASGREYASLADRYSRRHYVSFRDELQYDPAHPALSALDSRLNGTSRTEGVPDIYFDHTAMASYDRPYPVTPEVWRALGESELCTAYSLACGTNVYGTAPTMPSSLRTLLASLGGEVPEALFTEHTLVGGSLEAFTETAREVSRSAYDFILVEGTEPGPGQCAVTDFYASVYGKSVGDTLTLCDVQGEPVLTLTISGIYGLWEITNQMFADVDPAVSGSGRRLDGTTLQDFGGFPDRGTPYNRLGEDPAAQALLGERKQDAFCITGAMLAVIHTDFDTAYGLAPDTHFNRYFACYDLVSPDVRDDFAAAMTELFPAGFAHELTVYPFSATAENLLRQPATLADTAESYLRLVLPLTAFVLLVTCVFTLRENAREAGIYLSLGISEWDVCLKNGAEAVLTTALAGVLAAGAGALLYRPLSRGYIYLALLPTGFTLSWGALVYLTGCLLFCGLFSLLVSFLYVRLKPPAMLLRGM